MRTLIPLVFLLVVAVLALALTGIRYERARLLADFAATQQEAARQMTVDLGEELDELDDDARLVTTLRPPHVEGAVGPEEERLLLSGFQALATVVRHYRAVTLFDGDRLAVKAIDPAETETAASAFLAWSADAARTAHERQRPVLEGPREGPDTRQFFVYARPGRQGTSVVLVSEAKYLLQQVLRSRSPFVHYLLVDPTRAMWVGCAQPARCRAFASNEWPSIPGLASLMSSFQEGSGRRWDDALVPAAVGLDSRSAAIGWETLDRGGRRWVAAAVASAQAIEARERSLTWWLVGTSSGLAVSLTVVGMFIIRHQRRSVALSERLLHVQEIAHLRERTEKLIENVSLGLAAVTADGRVAIINRFLAERAPALQVGANVAQAVSGGDADAAARFTRSFDEALRTERARALSGADLPLFASRPGHFELRIIPLSQPAQDVRALLLVEDLSELKSLEKQLVRAEKLVTVGVLTAGLAHEIGTPLGIIRGRAELLMSRVKDTAIARDLESVIRQIDQIGSIIRQLLDFARAQPVALRAVQVDEAVTATLRMLEWRLRAKEIFVRVDTQPGLPPIAADPDQLQQVLVNLVLNACDACEKGGAIMVRIRPTAAGSKVVIDVQDDGCGIAEVDLNTVFDPFFTTKKRGEGTGLGLPVAASIVRNHQGDITLRSQRGQGTTATVTWPAVQEKARAHG